MLAAFALLLPLLPSLCSASPRPFSSSLETAAGWAAAAAASGPGTYAHYALPATPGGSTDIEHAVVWTLEPGADEKHGNAIFASTQMWQLAGPGGYMGTQRFLDTSTGRVVGTAIFSMWDASATVQTGWRGPNCERFGGEGTGAHCLIDFDLVAEDTYIVKVAADGHNASGAFWTGTVYDMRNSRTTTIGTLFHPNFNGAVGYGPLQVAAASFVEYFEADGCENQAQVGIGMLGPLFSNQTIRPTQATGDYAGGSPPCNFSDVTGCIPGLACGQPKVFHSVGGKVKRTTPAGVPLW
jgi:hypothetical protein